MRKYDPAFADALATKPHDSYQSGMEKPGACQTASVLSPYIYEEDNWTDDMELAAAELFLTTKNNQFLEQAIEYGRKEPVTPWMGADSARHYQWYPFMNMGHYRLASTGNQRVSNELSGTCARAYSVCSKKPKKILSCLAFPAYGVPIT
jgi:hypothetical protein